MIKGKEELHKEQSEKSKQTKKEQKGKRDETGEKNVSEINVKAMNQPFRSKSRKGEIQGEDRLNRNNEKRQ